MPSALVESYERVTERGPLPLDGMEITRAVLLRVSAFHEAQRAMKLFLGKRYAVAAADFFVETLAFYLKALAETHDLDFEVASERQIRRKRGAIRPDISMWRDDHCLACIECKTQLGWRRHNWETQFVEREQKLIAEFSGASTFLVVLTGLNWPGFGEHELLGRKYFLLLKDVWPGETDIEDLESHIETPIEGLFRHIKHIATLAD
jgi:hypothetical protein